MIYLIEWAQYLDYLIPKEYLKIHIDYTDKIELRNISIFSDSEKYSLIIKSIDEKAIDVVIKYGYMDRPSVAGYKLLLAFSKIPFLFVSRKIRNTFHISA